MIYKYILMYYIMKLYSITIMRCADDYKYRYESDYPHTETEILNEKEILPRMRDIIVDDLLGGFDLSNFYPKFRTPVKELIEKYCILDGNSVDSVKEEYSIYELEDFIHEYVKLVTSYKTFFTLDINDYSYGGSD